MRRITVLVLGFALAAAGCTGGDATDSTASTTAAATSTTVTTSPAVTTATTATTVAVTTTEAATTTSEAPTSVGAPLIRDGDRNETVEAFQYLLNCLGFGDLTVDGAYGPATGAAVEAAQTSLGVAADGEPGADVLAELTRRCEEPRRVAGDDDTTLVGVAGPDEPAAYPIALLEGSTMVITLVEGDEVAISLLGADGEEVPGQGQSTWEIENTQDYTVQVAAAGEDLATFEIVVGVTTGEREGGDWLIQTNSITYRGTKLTLGDDAKTVIDQVIDFLGHGVRGSYDEFDTGWSVITEPQEVGIRGLFIEGLAFLFFGPSPGDPDRPETLSRIRFVGPSDDANGDPRPANYVTTPEGVGVGDTLTDLRVAYDSAVTQGSNDDEFYYRLANTRGELCFYFDTDEAPTEFSQIVEIATECRS